MLTLLSPAKKLNMEPFDVGTSITQPRLLDDTQELAGVAKKQSSADLKGLMHISDKLAAINHERFQAFNLDNKSNSAKAAGFAFDGTCTGGCRLKPSPKIR